MNDKTFDPSTFVESFRNSLAPLLRAQTESLKALDRFAHHQYAIAGDYLEYGLAQAKAAVAAKTPNDLLAAQTELSTRLTEQLRARAQEFSTIAAEAQTMLNQFFSEATAKVAEVTKKAA